MPRGPKPLVAVVMGSDSDRQLVQPAVDLLDDLGIACEVRVLSAHRTPDETAQWAKAAESRDLQVIIAAAGGAAALPGAIAAHTLVPVLGVPVPSSHLGGLDALLSMVQMPRGVPVGTLAVGNAGPTNAALLAAQMVGLRRPEVRKRLRAWRHARRREILKPKLLNTQRPTKEVTP